MDVSRAVGTLVVLGDSVGVGLGDPIPEKEWRGIARLLADAVLPAQLVNLSVNGARLGSVCRDQLPQALRCAPDVAVVLAGMNDTMRADFDPIRLHADLDRIVSSLSATGALVLTIRYHDQGRVFRLPGLLHRYLIDRISELNTVIDVVARRHNSKVVDLAKLPGIYTKGAWSVDRLHPSELGHRILAQAFAQRIAESGLTAGEVSLDCTGGREMTRLQRVAWIILKGIPWLLRRSTDLVPHVTGILLRSLLRRSVPEQQDDPAPSVEPCQVKLLP